MRPAISGPKSGRESRRKKSLLAGYTSRSILFNVTGMSDREYEENMEWIESKIFKNYERMVKSDPAYWGHLGFHYARKIIQVKPVVRRLVKLLTRSRNETAAPKDFHSWEGAERYRNNLITYYPELFPDPDKPGFVNKPLIDERTQRISAQGPASHTADKLVPLEQVV